jgi:Holliday junction resolvase
VSKLAEELGHNVYNLSRKAKELGLTSYAYKKCPRSKLKTLSEDALRMIWDDYKASSFNTSEYCRRHGFDSEIFANIMRDRFPEYDDVIEAKRTKCTRYSSGRTFEYRVKRHLEEAGYFVMRAPQSKGPADLIAYDHGVCLLVQCKMGEWYEVDSWNEFYRLAVKHHAIPIYATKKENGRLALYRITGEKDRSRRTMPMVEYSATEGSDAPQTPYGKVP